MAENTKKINVRKRIIIWVIIILVIAAGVYLFFNWRSIKARLSADSSAPIPVQTGETDTNILVVYFSLGENSNVDAISSASVTAIDKVAYGNVRVIADEISKNTGGELFSVIQEEKYDASYSSVVDVAKQEQNDDARPALTTHIKNLDKFDTIFIGYPTWWTDLPQGMYTFFDEYDLSGKTIIPFNSANGSAEAGTVDTIKKLEPNAKVVDKCLSVHQSDIEDCADTVKRWLNELGY